MTNKDNSNEIINQFLDSYERESDFFYRLAEIVSGQCREWVKSNGIRAIISFREKDIESLTQKIIHRNSTNEYSSVKQIYDDIKDLAGVRIALYFPQDIDRVEEFITENFNIIGEPRIFNSKQLLRKTFFWISCSSF